MTHNVTVNADGTTAIQVDFADEGVNLQGQTSVKGDESAALAYLPTFEADLRRNNAELFPLPEAPEIGEEIE